MSTTQDTITEAQVTAWLTQKARQLSAGANDEYARVSVSVRVWGNELSHKEPDYFASVYVHSEVDGIVIERTSIEAAITEALNAASRDVIAENLRKKAAYLIAKARELESVRA